MKRFYNEDDDDEFIYGSQSEGDFVEPDEAFTAFIDKQDMLNVMQLDLAQIELNQQLLDKAKQIAEKNFWWYFKSPQKKTEEIEVIYRKLLELTDSKVEKEE